MKRNWALAMAGAALGLPGLANADQPAALPTVEVQNQPVVTSAAPPANVMISSTDLSACSSCPSLCAPACPSTCWDPPPMMGDLFIGALRGVGGGATTPGAPGTLQAVRVPITLPADPNGRIIFNVSSLNNISGGPIATPGGTFTSGNLLLNGQPVGPPATVTNINALYAGPGGGVGAFSVIDPNAPIIDGVRTVFPGATFITGSATRSGAVGSPNPVAASDTFDLALLFNFPGSAAAGLAFLVPEPGGFSRYTRISENGSPLPMDRVAYNYHYVDSVLGLAEIQHHRFTVEKTLFDGRASIQVNVPFGSTFNSNLSADALGDTNFEFGNVNVWAKYLLGRSETFALSAGVGVNTPTADDQFLFAAGNPNPLLRVRNESYMISPFVGALWMPNDVLFVQHFSQFDIDVNGNPVDASGQNVGRLESPTLYSAGTGVGLRLMAGGQSGITSITPMAEIHYTTSFGHSRTFNGPSGQISSRNGDVDVIDAVGGVNLGLGKRANVNLGVAAPITNSANRSYDWQAFAQLNFMFGGGR